MNYGKYYRIWPKADPHQSRLYVSVALARPFARPVCKLFASEDFGLSYRVIADFHSMEKRNTTTGQPFITNDGVILVPTWSAGFYAYGTTGLAIYRSEDQGMSWTKVYQNSKGTYAKHFFENPWDGNLYIGIGVGGGGSGGKIEYRPAGSYLLKSTDQGITWEEILKVDYPTALYDGTALKDQILVTARDKRSLYRSANGGYSWNEILVGDTPRNIFYSKNLDKIIVSSNSSIFVSSDGYRWSRFEAPIKWLILRYPTFHNGKIHMISAGPRSYIIATDLRKWYLVLDATQVAGSSAFTRMAVLNDYIFLGNELTGSLLRVKIPIGNDKPVTSGRILESNVRCFVSMVKYMARRILTRSTALD